jgi:hypothetical protein
MFCPQCQAEYRPGFTRCADCDVKLVSELPKEALLCNQPPPADRAEGSDEDPFVSFWRGDDPRIHAELCELLAENRIPYRSLRRQERLFAFSSRIAFAIGIPFSKFDQAEALIQEAYAAPGPGEPQPALLLAQRPSAPVRESALLRYTESGSAAASNTWEDAMATPSEMQGSFVTLWAGEDPVLHTSLLEELRHAEIPFIDKPIGRDSVAPTSDPLPIDWKARFGFEVAVSSAYIAAAEKILDKLLDEEPVDVALAAEDDVPPPAEPPHPSHLSKTTAVVWSGDDSERADFLSEALKENEIPVRLEAQGNQSTLYVPPEEETLAREIIREILEGQPPA